MNSRRLATWLADQMGDNTILPNTAVQIRTVEDVRAYQIVMNAGLALSTGSRLLRDKVRKEYGSFVVHRLSNEETPADMISGVPFQVENTVNHKG